MSLFVPNTLFLFCGRSASKIKGLLWEGDGFLLLYKRVESGHFSWPQSSDELRAMDARQFDWLMKGFSIDPVTQNFLQCLCRIHFTPLVLLKYISCINLFLHII